MIIAHRKLTTRSKQTCTSSPVIALMFLLWSSLLEVSDAWRCGRCNRTTTSGSGCADGCHGFSETTPIYECLNQPNCTRVYTCGNTTYACNPVFDFAIIQFNAEPESSCASLIPLVPQSHRFEYCKTDLYCGSSGHLCFDCSGLCGLTDDQLAGHVCPNGEQIDFYFTVCNEDFPGDEFSTYITEQAIHDFDADLLNEMRTNSFFNMYGGIGHSSCFNFGNVSCGKLTRIDEPGLGQSLVFVPPTSPPSISLSSSASFAPSTSMPPSTSLSPSTSPCQNPTTKKGKKGKKGGKKEGKKKNKANGDDESEPCCRRNLRLKKKGRSSSFSSSLEEEKGEGFRDC